MSTDMDAILEEHDVHGETEHWMVLGQNQVTMILILVQMIMLPSRHHSPCRASK